MLLGKIIRWFIVSLLFSFFSYLAPEINKCSNNRAQREDSYEKNDYLTLVAVWMMITSMNAQRLTNIQAEASLTDKMVVELGIERR